jgi:hypothetical protein
MHLDLGRRLRLIAAAAILVVICWSPVGFRIAEAAFGEDLEKPKPEFTVQDGQIVAKLVPRGKSTSILIDFKVVGGRLGSVESVDLNAANYPDIDSKDFRSGLFGVEIEDLSAGAEVEFALRSSFFTGATELWALNREQKATLTNVQAQNLDRPDRVQALVFKVADGGPFDNDGVADGRILLILGPQDSFWGYALGTLFIRFFGIFIVLGLLQAGMVLTGAIFQQLQKKADRKQSTPRRGPVEPVADETLAAPDPETAIAIALALHMHLGSLRASSALNLMRSDGSSWTRQGRSQIMRDRLMTQDRAGRK